MKKLIGVVLVLWIVVAVAGCTRGMVRASEIQPAVDILVPDYVDLKTDEEARTPGKDPIFEKKIKMARELKETVDLALKGGK